MRSRLSVQVQQPDNYFLDRELLRCQASIPAEPETKRSVSNSRYKRLQHSVLRARDHESGSCFRYLLMDRHLVRND
jgi:hypothetical protein